MILYESGGPNPRIVKMLIIEKGIDVPRVAVDALRGESRQPAFVARNPAATTPALELDDGRVIAESTVIAEYLDELHPSPPLIGHDAASRAETRMWMRRVTLKVTEPLTYGFRFGEGIGIFADRVRCLPDASSGFKAIARDGLAWFEAQMTDRAWVGGQNMTLADIMLFCFVEFGAKVGQPLDPDHRALAGWVERMKARPSAIATD
jgi:glutathione S-transferase